MATVINTVERMVDKAVYALTGFGLSRRAALSLIVDVCKARMMKESWD